MGVKFKYSAMNVVSGNHINMVNGMKKRSICAFPVDQRVKETPFMDKSIPLSLRNIFQMNARDVGVLVKTIPCMARPNPKKREGKFLLNSKVKVVEYLAPRKLCVREFYMIA